MSSACASLIQAGSEENQPLNGAVKLKTIYELMVVQDGVNERNAGPVSTPC